MKKTIFIWSVAIVLVITAVFTIKDFDNKISVSANKSNSLQVENSASNVVPKENLLKLKAPDFTLKDLDDKEVSLKDFKGKNVYINFWATWCPPCRAEMPEIEKLYQESKDSDLIILTVNVGEDQKTVKEFMMKNNYNFKVLLDTEGIASNLYDISSIPVSIFINKDGDIVNRQVGAMNIDMMKDYINSIK